MMNWLSNLVILAEEAEAAKPQGSFFDLMGPLIFPLAMIFVMYQLLIAGPQRRERRKRDELLGNLKKNDKVLTIGGVIGTVANVSADGEEVTIRVEDNARIRFRRSAIQTVYNEGSTDDASKKS